MKIFIFLLTIILLISTLKYLKKNMFENFTNKNIPYQIEFSEYPTRKMVDKYKKCRNKCIKNKCKDKCDIKFVDTLSKNNIKGFFCGKSTGDYREFPSDITSTQIDSYNNQYKQDALYFGSLPKSLHNYCNKINNF